MTIRFTTACFIITLWAVWTRCVRRFWPTYGSLPIWPLTSQRRRSEDEPCDPNVYYCDGEEEDDGESQPSGPFRRKLSRRTSCATRTSTIVMARKRTTANRSRRGRSGGNSRGGRAVRPECLLLWWRGRGRRRSAADRGRSGGSHPRGTRPTSSAAASVVVGAWVVAALVVVGARVAVDLPSLMSSLMS